MKSVRRLLIRPGAIGDCILTFPAMEALRDGYTEVWVPSPLVPLVRFADRVRSLASTGIDLVGISTPTLSAFFEFDEIVSWYGTARPEFREAVARLPFRFHPALPPPPGVPKIACTPVPHGSLVVHPFSGSARKNWPLDRFRALGGTVITGPEQPLHGAAVIEDLYELARYLAGARAFVGNDSGITHLAAAVGCPLIALFGPTDPALWAPRGDRVRVIHKSKIEDITVDDVLTALDELAGRGHEDDHAGRDQESVRAD